MPLSRHPSYGTSLCLLELGRLLAFPRDIKKQWELCTIDDVILVVPKNGVDASQLNGEPPSGGNRETYQKVRWPRPWCWA
jgi:hypothetical protein